MGSFAPVLLAFILNCCGATIFREANSVVGCEPLVSCLIFLFAIFLLLWDLRLYPTSLRRVWRCGDKVLDFFLAMFLMEHIMSDFWFPLDTYVVGSVPKIADWERDLLAQGGYQGDGIFQFTREEVVGVIASYMLSIFFLLCVLHATRAVDFRLLQCGFPIFISDITLRLKRVKKKIIKTFRFQKGIKLTGGSKGECSDFCSTCKLKQSAEKFLTENNLDECQDSDSQPRHSRHHNYDQNSNYDCPRKCNYDYCAPNERRRRRKY